MNTVEELLDKLDDILEDGFKMPLMGGRCVIDSEHVRSVVDEIRLHLPREIKESVRIVEDRENIIRDAKKEAEGIIRSAEDRARALVAQHEIMRQAQAKANEMLSQAQAKSREMRRAAQEYVDDLMCRADEGLTANLAEVRKTRASLKSTAQPQPIPQNIVKKQ